MSRGNIIVPDRHVSTIPMQVLDDDRLTWKAVGVYAYLFSLENGTQINEIQLSRIRIRPGSKNGRDAMSSALAQLERFGYLTRVRHKKSERESQKPIDWIVKIPAIEEDAEACE